MRGTIEAGGRVRLQAEPRLTPRYLGANKTCLTLPAPHSQLRHRTGGRQKNEQRLTHNNIFLVKKQPRLVSGYLRVHFLFQSRLVFYVRVIILPLSSLLYSFWTGLLTHLNFTISWKISPKISNCAVPNISNCHGAPSLQH